MGCGRWLALWYVDIFWLRALVFPLTAVPFAMPPLLWSGHAAHVTSTEPTRRSRPANQRHQPCLSPPLSTFFPSLSLAWREQEQEAEKREKLEKELKALDAWAAASAGEGEACGWLCGEAGEGRMTLADVAYFPFLERIAATLEPFKVGLFLTTFTYKDREDDPIEV